MTPDVLEQERDWHDHEPCRPCLDVFGEEQEPALADPTPEELAADGRRALDRIHAIAAEKE